MSRSNINAQSIGRAIANALSAKREHTKQIPTRTGRSRITRTRRIQTARNSGTTSWSRSLPASYANHVRPSFRVLNRTANSLRVSGCDLVYPLPARIASTSAEEFLFSVIPANPAYWTGTRVAQMAPAYMNYRPLRMTFHYIPQVAVTQAGSVMFGTLWNGTAPADDIQQSLNTSNGGGIINCYVPASTQISLGSNLQQNLFTLNGDINPSTSPFIFVALARGCFDSNNQNVVPGYFMVDYVYDFKNAIGQTWLYDRSLAVQAPVTSWSLPNRSLVLLESIAGYGPGTIFDAEEQSDGTTNYYYRGTPVSIPEGTWVQSFENGQTSSPQLLLSRIAELENREPELPIKIDSSAFKWYYNSPKLISQQVDAGSIIVETENEYRFIAKTSNYTIAAGYSWWRMLAEPDGLIPFFHADDQIIAFNCESIANTNTVTLSKEYVELPHANF